KIVVHRFHYPSGAIVLNAAMMKKKFRQGGKQRSSGPVAGTIGNPKQDSAIFHPQPAIDIAAYLDDRSITGGDFPACNGGWLLWNSVQFSPGISTSRRRSVGRLACASANASAPSSHSWHW